jgi:hypothetical protein
MGDFDDFLDPAPAQFTGDTLLERVSRAYEDAVDEFGNAADTAALRENDYLRAYAVAWAEAVEDGVPSTARDKHCKTRKDVVDAQADWNRAVAAEKRCKAKVQELQTRMTAAMSHQRFVREGT